MKENKDWRELCKQASVEPDPKKLMRLVSQSMTYWKQRKRD
jgi:hypothetical protein